MTFQFKRRTATLVFDPETYPDLAGLEMTVRLDISTASFFELERLKVEAADGDQPARVQRMLAYFTEHIAESWNAVDEEGNPIPLTLDVLLTLPPNLTLNLIPLWKELAIGVSAPLGGPSASGDTSPESSTPSPER